jgi:antitoxin ChpS
MSTAKLRSVGGSTMVAIPPAVLKSIKIGPNSEVSIRVDDGRIIIEAVHRPTGRVGLAERLARCDFSQPISSEEQSWVQSSRIGREEL